MIAREIQVLADPAAIAREAADRIVALSRAANTAGSRFSIALSGGSTPKILYTLLASAEFQSRIDWTRFDIFFGDERSVTPDHPESNYRMADEALLSRAPIPKANVYRMKGEIDPQLAAKEYGLMLKEKFGAGGLDLVLLGMGDDGHTASLFPGTKAVDEIEHRVVANYAENSTTGKSWRITMTALFINRAQNVIVLLAGAGKADRLKEVLEGPNEPRRLPIQMIQPTNGKMTWLVDKAAGARLKPRAIESLNQ